MSDDEPMENYHRSAAAAFSSSKLGIGGLEELGGRDGRKVKW